MNQHRASWAYPKRKAVEFASEGAADDSFTLEELLRTYGSSSVQVGSQLRPIVLADIETRSFLICAAVTFGINKSVRVQAPLASV